MSPPPVRLLYCPLGGESGLPIRSLEDRLPTLDVDVLGDPSDASDRIEAESYDIVVGRCETDIERGLSVLSSVSAADPALRTVLLSETYGDDSVSVPEEADVDGYVRIRDDADEVTALASYLRNRFSLAETAIAAGPSGGTRSKGEGETDPVIRSDIDDSAGQLESVARTTPDAILTIDESSVVRFVNPAIEEILGYSPEEVIGEPLTMLMSDALADEHRTAFARYRETGVKRLTWDDIELPGRHADGHEVPLSISFSEFTRDGSQFFTGILRDVSERKEREAERRLLHDVTRRIAGAESFDEGLEIALREVGEAMNWVYGEAWVPDEEREALVRRDERYVATEEYAGFHERSRSVTFGRDSGLPGRVWESGEPRWIPDVTTEASSNFVRTASARECGLQAVLGVPIVADGEVIAVLVFALPESREPDERMIEATSGVAASLGRLMLRKRAEQALHEERDLKTRILETSPIGLVIVDDDGEFEYVNDTAESILGLSESDDGPLAYEDLRHQPLDDDGEPLDESDRPYRRVKETGESYQGQLRIRRPDGDVRWLSVNGTPFESDRGEVTKTVFAFEDVTEDKERERELELSNQMLETVRDGVYALDDRGRFVSVNRAYAEMVGYERERLLGEHATTVTSDRANAELEALQADLTESDSDAVTYETTVETADGDRLPIEAHISLFPMGDGTYGRVGVVRDITARKRREEQLKQLNEFAQALTSARSMTEVCDIAVETARETMGLPLTTIDRYDDQSGRLESVSRTPEVDDLIGPDDRLFEHDRDPPWEAYAEQRDRVLDDITEETAVSETTPLRSAIVVPVGTFGVFVSGSTEPNAFSTQDVTLANIFAANVEAAIERVDREEQLRDRKEELEEKTETLERVNRINSEIRDITRTLTRATTRTEIEQAVCAKLANAEPYRFAWVGKQRTIGGEIEPRASAGVGRGYLDSIRVTADDTETGMGPAGRAVETREPQVQNNLHSDPPFEPWRVEALQRGYRASISIPLVNNETLYGTLNLYADEADVFDEMEVAVLGELGEMIGYAISAMERKKALVSGTSVELTLELDDTSIPAIAFARETDSGFEFEALVEQTDGSLRAFFTVSDCTPRQAERYAETCPSVREMNLIAGRDDGCFYEAVISQTSFFAELLEAGAHPTALSATPSGGRLTVELPRSGDIKAFLQTFTERYDGVELVSRKELDRPVKTEQEFQTLYEERLTEREEEVLRTAYYAGFFDFPRDSSASDVADILGVSQPTVSRHVRRGQQKMMDMVFDDGSKADPDG